MNTIYWLEQIYPSKLPSVGKKAFTLSRLQQEGYPVIPGFVIPSSTLQEFLAMISDSEPWLADFPHSSLRVDVEDHKALQALAQSIRRSIMGTALPTHWISQIIAEAAQWKSSALIFRASLLLPGDDSQLVGLLQSHACLCEAQQVERTLKQAWAELFRARSLFYWQKAEIELETIRLAILVQPLENAIASGTLETYQDEGKIQATWGLGHSWVKGEVSPDLYQVQLSTGKILTRQRGQKVLAYSLNQNSQDCLQVELITEEKLQEYAIEPELLAQLLKLAQQLQASYPDYCAEWAYCRPLSHLPQGFYLTQVDPFLLKQPLLTTPPPISLSSNLPPLTKGLSASSGYAIAPAHVIVNSTQPLLEVAAGKILVTRQLTPDWLPFIQRAAGIVTEQGGMTNHAAIIARELRIPAVVSAQGITEIVQTGDLLLLDGNRGEIRYASETEESLEMQGEVPKITHSFESTVATQLWVNLSQTSSVANSLNLPVDGIGLLRSELMMLDLWASQPPQVWLHPENQKNLTQELRERIRQFAEAFLPKPIFYRSSDWHFSENFLSSKELTENDPYLNYFPGKRGAFYYQQDPTLFDIELEALTQLCADGFTNINLILPFVRSLEEFRFCQNRVKEKKLDQFSFFQLWIMAEVPSVLFLLPEYVQAGVQGIAIGTNDLTQLLLGFDREEADFSGVLNELHPAVLIALKNIIQSAQKLNIPCSICGQAPVRYPQLIEKLIRWGITSISVEPDAVLRTHSSILRAEKNLLLEAARKILQD